MKIFSSIDDEKKTSISNNATWQLIGKFFLQGIIFFTTPIFTRILTPADYGITSLFNTWVSICTLLIGLQTYGTIGNARLKFVKEEFNKYLSSILTISVISFVILLVVSICFGRSLSKIMGLSFDGNGCYVGWSNLFKYDSIETLKASEFLPMPKKKVYKKTNSGVNIDSFINEII